MADVTEKILNTRIQLKYDTYANWKTNNPVLKKGELAIVEIPADNTDANGVVQKPNYLLKVGDGEKNFLALEFIAAKAADVHDWAKAAAKPTYTISEIGGYDTIDTDTQYKLVQDATDGHIIKLQSMPKNGTTWTDVATITTVDTLYNDAELKARLDALEEKVGSQTVQAAIEAYVTSLDLANTYEAKGAAAAAQAAAEATAAGALASAKSELSANIATAQGAAEAAQGDVDDLAEYVGEFTPVGEETTVVGYVDAKVAAANEVSNGLNGRVTANEGAIATLQSNSATKTELGEAKTELQGKIDLKASQADLNAATGRITANEGAIATLQSDSATKSELNQAKTDLTTEINKKADQTALDATNGRVTTLETASADHAGKLTKLIGDDANKSVRDIATAVLAEELIPENADVARDTLEEIAAWIQSHPGDAAAMNSAIATLQSESATKAELAEAQRVINEALALKATEADLTLAEGRIKANEDAISSLQTNSATKSELSTAQSTLQGNIDKKADQTALDATNGRVTANEGAISGLQAKVDTGDKTVSEYVEQALTDSDLSQYAKQADLNTANGKIAANEGAISALQTNSATKAELQQAQSDINTELAKKATEEDLTQAEGRITALETADGEQDTLISGLRTDLNAEIARAGAAEQQNAEDIDALEASVNGLANIAKTGSTDDLVQGSMTLVFDCGNSQC